MNRQEDIGYLVKRVSDRLRSAADANMKNRNLTYSQCNVLKCLDDNSGCASQKQIEELLGVAHPTVVGLVSRLEKNGFVESRTDEKDRRIKWISVTKKAADVRAEVAEERREAEKRLTRNLSEEEIIELRRMLQVIYQTIEEERNV